jgi:hypothetical protein
VLLQSRHDCVGPLIEVRTFSQVIVAHVQPLVIEKVYRRGRSAVVQGAAVAALLALFLAPPASALPKLPAGRTYYVDSRGGDDSRSGTNPEAAWRSLGRATRVRLHGGDRVLLRRGSDWSGPFDLTASGTRGRSILIGAYGAGPRPLVRGGSTCVRVGGSFVRLTQIEARGCAWAGVSIDGSFVQVDHMRVSGNAAGVDISPGSRSAAILFNELVDNNHMSVLTKTPTNDDSGAFGILVQGDGARIAHNSISGSDAFSYDYGRDGAAIEIFGGRDNLIEWNVATDDHAFTELGNPRTARNTYAYNLYTASAADATFLVTRGSTDSRGPVLDTRVNNNTAVVTGTGSQGVVCYAGCSSGILTLRNNIVVARRALYADAPFDEAHDVFYGHIANVTLGPGSIVADPRFRAPSAHDFRLSASSPAVDRGVQLGFSHDLAGDRVPVDGDGDGKALPDSGCFEYQPPRSEQAAGGYRASEPLVLAAQDAAPARFRTPILR